MRALFKLQTVGSLFGIPIRVMPAVMLLVLFFLASAFSLPAPEGPFPPGASPPPTPNLPFVFGLFVGLIASLLAHEIAHAWVAKQRGFRVVDIIIWPLGGMARVEGLSESPRNEALVAFAGPLANLLLALVFCVIPGEFAHMLLLMNLVLGIGNLVPIFPLDGGRVLRAFLAHNAPLASATKAAIQVSNWALLIFVVVAFQEGWFFLGLLLGAYLWFAGRMEMVQILVRQGP
ncbi:MAG: site-2 protease family protein, partial [Planctomycetes bacterium]|nr:site-2 protease family protein [Planctomycetota bacterium]